MSAEQAQQNPTSAGALLRQLRLEQGLSIDDISKRTHLAPRIIAALEADNFAILPSATYARGYLRNYARLLGADEDAVISLYNDDAPEAPEIIPEVRHPRQISSSDKPVKVFSYLLSLVLVLLFIAWWQSDHMVPPARETQKDAAPAAREDAVPTNSAPEADAAEAMPDAYAEEMDSGAAAQEDYADDNGTAEMAQDASAGEKDAGAAAQEEYTDDSLARQATDAVAAEQAAPAGDLATAAVLADDDTRSEAETETQATTAPQDAEAIDRRGEGPDELIISLDADSWVEVFAADGAQLYLDLARRGQTLILQGRAPFRILLGFSAGALVRFNGEQIDHARHARAGVAQFRLSNAGTSAVSE